MNNSLQNIIEIKNNELTYLKKELANSLGNIETDYEYANILLPVIRNLETELKKLHNLDSLSTIDSPGEFRNLLLQLLNGEILSIGIHISLNYNKNIYEGPLIQIQKLKTRSAFKSYLYLDNLFNNFIFYDCCEKLKQIGWNSIRKNKFSNGFSIKQQDDVQNYHMFISRTLMEPLADIIKKATKHFLVVNINE